MVASYNRKYVVSVQEYVRSTPPGLDVDATQTQQQDRRTLMRRTRKKEEEKRKKKVRKKERIRRKE